MFSRKPSKAGIIGLGIIGSRVAEVHRQAGLHVYVWSRSPKPEPNFVSSPEEVATLAEHIEIFVPGGEDLVEVVEAMAPQLTKKHFVINHSTVSLEATLKAASLVQAAGARFADCPFTGSRDAAAAGKLVYYLSAPAAIADKIRPLLELSSREILQVGESPGQATVLKIATNMISATTVQALSESLALTRSQGITGEALGEALALNACASDLTQMKLPTMIAGDYTPHFSLRNMFKDAQFALSLANQADLELPALSTTASVMFNTIRRGRGEEDYSVVCDNFKPRESRVRAEKTDSEEEPAEEIPSAAPETEAPEDEPETEKKPAAPAS
ncbi:MAG: NAD(P)-dependent oxidoreductase [Verrucomicrobiales bacterium]